MLTVARDNISDEAVGQYPVLLSPDLIEEYELYMDLDYETASGLETLIQHPNNGLNIVIISILLILGLTNNLIAFPVMLFR